MRSRFTDLIARWRSKPKQIADPIPDAGLSGADVLASLYTPWGKREPMGHFFRDPARLKIPATEAGLPLPPPHLRMGYSVHDDQAYSSGGRSSADGLRNILRDCGFAVETCGAVMDWGCSTGRVLRWFAEEAEQEEYWGVDQDELSITWNQENLCPPFRFLTCTSYPHLPFVDEKFGLIYALSVFTHLEHHVDLWLMEMHRILRTGGVAIFTIHDEHTVQSFVERGRPAWIPADLSLQEIAEHEITVIRGPRWFETYTFFSTSYVRKAWGRYFEICTIRPRGEGYQSVVVLRKP